MIMQAQLLWIIGVPLLAAVGIGLVGQRHQNIREAITLIAGVCLALLVWSLLPEVLAGARPSAHLVSMLPGISLGP